MPSVVWLWDALLSTFLVETMCLWRLWSFVPALVSVCFGIVACISTELLNLGISQLNCLIELKPSHWLCLFALLHRPVISFWAVAHKMDFMGLYCQLPRSWISINTKLVLSLEEKETATATIRWRGTALWWLDDDGWRGTARWQCRCRHGRRWEQ